MSMARFLACTVSVTFLLSAALVIAPRRSMSTGSTPPTLDVPSEIKQGTPLTGSAADPNAPIVVTATYNGQTIGTDSSPGSINSFSFSTAGVPVGGLITVSATDDCGNQTVTTVEVVRCPHIIP